MIIDDEPEIIEELAEFITGIGFKCRTSTNPFEAIDEICLDQKISILVTDLRMPGMNGLEMIKALQDRSPIGLSQSLFR